MPPRVTIESLPDAFDAIKEMAAAADRHLGAIALALMQNS